MGWFSKKEEEVPKIPMSPTLPEIPREDMMTVKEIPELPSFPNSSMNDNLNQEMIKSAVMDNPSPGENEVHAEIPRGVRITEESGGDFLPPVPSRIPTSSEEHETSAEGNIQEGGLPPISRQEIIKPKHEDSFIPEPPRPAPISTREKTPLPVTKEFSQEHLEQADKPAEPIFVRIDKFQSSQKNFEKIKDKVGEIESVLHKIDDIRKKEDEELNKWIKEVEMLKIKLSEIDSEVFGTL
ncbi:MAG: hypothetical protein ABIF88_02055 [archaeon]